MMEYRQQPFTLCLAGYGLHARGGHYAELGKRRTVIRARLQTARSGCVVTYVPATSSDATTSSKGCTVAKTNTAHDGDKFVRPWPSQT